MYITEPGLDNNEIMGFLYRMPVAVAQISTDGDIKMLSPRATALLTPLSGEGFFSNLFTVLYPVAPQIRRLSDEYLSKPMEQQELGGVKSSSAPGEKPGSADSNEKI